MMLVGLMLACAMGLGAMLPTADVGAQSLPTEITMELGDLVALPAQGVATYSLGAEIIDVDVSRSLRWFVISTLALGSSSLLFITHDGTQTRCRLRIVPVGTLRHRPPVTTRLPVGGELRIASGDIASYREGDASTLDVHVSTDGAQIIVVGLRPGRSALLLEHRTGRVEILQLGVGP
jgi:hypothetical protein